MMRAFIIIAAFSFALSSCNMNPTKGVYNSKVKPDSIIVDKSDHKLYLIKNGKVIEEYNARFGFSPVDHKMYEGDGKTPEGNYFITNKNFNSKYYLSLLVSYPNDEDVFTALRMDKNPGGSIMVHGQPNEAGWLERLKNENKDWTFGCIALSNRDIVDV